MSVLLVMLTAAVIPTPGLANESPTIPEIEGVIPAALQLGDRGDWVVDLQQALTDLGFSPGPADGRFGRHTRAAVYAFQKHHRLERSGVFTEADWDLLEMPVDLPGWGPELDRVEIDLDRQLLYLIKEGDLSGVFPVSSANGETFINYTGRRVAAVTPEGRFTFNRRREGWWQSYLGFLYRPFYFRGGYAIHGSSSVPPFPASHGCVRVEVADMDYLVGQFELGMPVYVYGRDLQRSDLIAEPPVEPKPFVPPSNLS
jgi:N-acetylmuramoyl-L-alanine amidase